MKIKLLLVILLLSSIFLFSCQYDKTTDFRALFTQGMSYRGQLRINDVSHSVCVIRSDEKELTLQFLDGPLQGMEKHFTEEGESDLYEGMEFSLARASDYYAIYQTFLFLSKQVYHCPSLKEDQSFSFQAEHAQIHTTIDPQNDTVKQISISTDRENISFTITEQIKGLL